MPKCYLCVFESDDPVTLTKHIIRSHKDNAASRVQCQFCGVTYSKWDSFKKHLQRKHATEIPRDPPGPDPENENDGNPADELPENDIEEDQQVAQEQTDGGVQMNSSEIHRWRMAKFLLKIREDGSMTQTAVNLVVEGVDEIVKSHVATIQAKLMDAKESQDSTTLPVTVVNRVLEESKEVSCFEGVNSKYLLDKFLEEQGAVKAEELFLGTFSQFTKSDPPRIVEKRAFAYYIPLEADLEKLLSHPEILNYVENPVVGPGHSVIRDLRDGLYFKNHPIFSVDLQSLIILFYWDELQTTNLAGAKPQKFAMFYWQLGNIPTYLRSTLRAINVYAIAKSSFVKRFGLDKIFRMFVADIKKLQEGLLAVNGARKTFRGSLLFVSADTPAAQACGKFKEGVGGAWCPCRICTATKLTLQDKFMEKDFVLRNKQTHEEQVRFLKDDSLSAEELVHYSKEFGVTGQSEFSALDDFDVTKCLVQDAMHVFLEGVLALEIRLFFKFVIEKRLVGFKTINAFLTSFNSGHLKVDHPSLLEMSHLDNGLRQSSLQTLALSHMIPFVMKGRLESDSDAVDRLNNFVRLLQIVDLSLAFEFTKDDVSLLKHMMVSYFVNFKILYPDVKLVPKHHYMIHFPAQIRNFGPLRFQWCVRYEAAHAGFKRLMAIVLCYKNPPLTMMSRYCAKRTNLLLVLPGSTDDKFLDLGDEVKSGTSVKVRDHPHSDILRTEIPILQANDTVLNSKSMTVRGIHYQEKESIILLESPDDDLPVFGRIELVTVYGQKKIVIPVATDFVL